uniref:Odorant binding protein 3 n=1 Tax=Rhynchophorus ferrugineus TaxID=354439 RepID=A0A1C8K2C2_RHYFE|nr:odorant binding protein 3 [Rhynchophorus ferrugineus]
MEKLFILLLQLVVLFVVVAGELTADQRKQFIVFQNECMQETGATDDMIMKALAGVFSDSPVFKNHLVCMGLKTGIIDSDGNFHKDILKKGIMLIVNNEAKVDAMLDKCHVYFETQQESAFHLMKCLYEEHFGA